MAKSMLRRSKWAQFVTWIKHPTFNKDKVRKFLLGTKEKNGFLKQLVVYVLLICIGFVYLYPILYMVSRSMMELEDLLDSSISWIPSSLNFNNYKQAGTSMQFWKTLWQSIYVAGVPTLINMVVCAVIGYGFARFEFRGKKLFMALLIFSFILPSQITMMPQYVMYNARGITGTMNAFIYPALLGQGLKAQLFILIYYQFFKQVPKVLLEAAMIDGAGYFKAFIKIAIPSAAPAILTVSLFSFVWYWNESYLTELFVTGIKNKTRVFDLSTLVVKLKNFDSNYSDVQYTGGVTQNNNESIQMAATLLSVLPVLIIYFVLQRYFVESIDRTGITGE